MVTTTLLCLILNVTSVLPALIFLLTTNGLITGSLATAREWEARTIKELLTPVSQATIVTGKVLASFVPTFLMGTLVLGVLSMRRGNK